MIGQENDDIIDEKQKKKKNIKLNRKEKKCTIEDFKGLFGENETDVVNNDGIVK